MDTAPSSDTPAQVKHDIDIHLVLCKNTLKVFQM